jgi:hypothetical protein
MLRLSKQLSIHALQFKLLTVCSNSVIIKLNRFYTEVVLSYVVSL